MSWYIVRYDPETETVIESFIREDGVCHYMIRDMTPDEKRMIELEKQIEKLEEKLALTPSSVCEDQEEGEQ